VYPALETGRGGHTTEEIMPPATPTTTDDDLIRERIDGIADALRVKDTEALIAHYASDCVIFDLMPLQPLA
jgi:ketosteroid isomerase-like protein